MILKDESRGAQSKHLIIKSVHYLSVRRPSWGEVNLSNCPINMDDLIFQRSSDALHYLDSKIPPELRLPSVGVICGSGLGELAKTVIQQPRFEVDYNDIPHFPASKGSSK